MVGDKDVSRGRTRICQLPATTKEVGVELGSDSAESDDEKGNEVYTQASRPAASGADVGSLAASGAAADWVLTNAVAACRSYLGRHGKRSTMSKLWRGCRAERTNACVKRVSRRLIIVGVDDRR